MTHVDVIMHEGKTLFDKLVSCGIVQAKQRMNPTVLGLAARLEADESLAARAEMRRAGLVPESHFSKGLQRWRTLLRGVAVAELAPSSTVGKAHELRRAGGKFRQPQWRLDAPYNMSVVQAQVWQPAQRGRCVEADRRGSTWGSLTRAIAELQRRVAEGACELRADNATIASTPAALAAGHPYVSAHFMQRIPAEQIWREVRRVSSHYHPLLR
jgi:hypothetical protein